MENKNKSVTDPEMSCKPAIKQIVPKNSIIVSGEWTGKFGPNWQD